MQQWKISRPLSEMLYQWTFLKRSLSIQQAPLNYGSDEETFEDSIEDINDFVAPKPFK